MGNILSTLINLYILIIIIRVAMSWIGVESNNQIVRFMDDITEPVLKKIRDLIPPIGGFDLSPMVLILGLIIIRNLLFPGY